MLGTCIDEQVTQELVTKTRLREHTLYRSPNQFGGVLGEDFLRRREALSARITGVAGVNAVRHLLAFEGDLLTVDDDDVVTAVHVRREARLRLATEDKRDAGSETTKREIRRINDDPTLLDSSLVQGNRLVALCVHCLDL